MSQGVSRRFIAHAPLVAGRASSPACGTVLIVSRKPFRRNFRKLCGLKLRWWKSNLTATVGVFWILSLQMLRIETEWNGTHSEESQKSPRIPERCYHYFKSFCSRAKSVLASFESCQIVFCMRSTIILFLPRGIWNTLELCIYMCFVFEMYILYLVCNYVY